MVVGNNVGLLVVGRNVGDAEGAAVQALAPARDNCPRGQGVQGGMLKPQDDPY